MTTANILVFIKDLIGDSTKMEKFKEVIADIKELIKDIKDVIKLTK